MLKPQGIITPIITPMFADESVNHQELRVQINRQIACGVSGLFCLGTNGEVYALNTDEKLAIIKTVVEETNGRVPVYAGTGCICTKETIELSLQAKLLRVLQESELDRVGGSETVKVDVRVIATTNRDLAAWVEEGKFRQDLYFRLNVIPLTLPPLRERGGDVELLARFFMEMYSKDYGIANVSLSSSALDWLKTYGWPGNVRELQNLMERAVLLCGGRPIEPGHFLLDPDNWPVFLDGDAAIEAIDPAAGEALPQGGEAPAPGPDAPLPQVAAAEALPQSGGLNPELFSAGVIPLHEMERLMIIRGLEQTSGNRTQAAELLGISVRTLRNKLNEYRELGVEVF